MFKLAGRHEWEASTKGKWNIQRACGRRGRKEKDREGHVVSSSCENIGGDVRKRGEWQMIDKGVSATAIPGGTHTMKGRKWTQGGLGIGILNLELMDFLRRFESSIGLVVLSDNRLYRTIPLLHSWVDLGSCFNKNLV